MQPRYVPVRFLAAGGMAEVILARQVLDDGVERTVVVKQVLRHLAREHEFIDMFASEMRLAVLLRHPNIVQVLDAGENDGVPFLAMEALFGADLRTVLRESLNRGIRAPLDVALSICADVARGLHYAHTLVDGAGRALGVVHRDISPHNIFITRDGTAKILEFGIAKSTAQFDATATGITKGKAGYMAPEQIRGGTLDARTDVYALGVVLWESIVCRRLWKRESDMASAMATLETDPAAPSATVPNVPPELDALVLSMLARDPAARPINAAVVAHALDAILAKRGCTAPRAPVVALLRDLVPEQTDDFDSSATVPAIGDFGGGVPVDEGASNSRNALGASPVTRLSVEIANPSPPRKARNSLLVAIVALVGIAAFASAMWVTKAFHSSATIAPTVTASPSTVRAAVSSQSVTDAASAIGPVAPRQIPDTGANVVAHPIAQPEPTTAATATASHDDHAIRPSSHARTAHRTRMLPVGATFRE